MYNYINMYKNYTIYSRNIKNCAFSQNSFSSNYINMSYIRQEIATNKIDNNKKYYIIFI